jgi:hypothetical protein
MLDLRQPSEPWIPSTLAFARLSIPNTDSKVPIVMLHVIRERDEGYDAIRNDTEEDEEKEAQGKVADAVIVAMGGAAPWGAGVGWALSFSSHSEISRDGEVRELLCLGSRCLLRW